MYWQKQLSVDGIWNKVLVRFFLLMKVCLESFQVWRKGFLCQNFSKLWKH